MKETVRRDDLTTDLEKSLFDSVADSFGQMGFQSISFCDPDGSNETEYIFPESEDE